jgi:hypothetical protein
MAATTPPAATQTLTRRACSRSIPGTLCQIAAVDRAYPDDERITLQGHGLYCDGAWTIYW